jgi:hypothetical protein
MRIVADKYSRYPDCQIERDTNRLFGAEGVEVGEALHVGNERDRQNRKNQRRREMK